MLDFIHACTEPTGKEGAEKSGGQPRHVHLPLHPDSDPHGEIEASCPNGRSVPHPKGGAVVGGDLKARRPAAKDEVQRAP